MKLLDRTSRRWLFILVPGVTMASFHSIFINLGKTADGKIPFSSSSVALLIELFKLLASLVFMYGDWRKGEIVELPHNTILLLYTVPALLYALNNNLVIHIQMFMDPASFQVLNNLKIVASAVFYKLIIDKYVSKRKWIAVLFLFAASFIYSLGGLRNSASRDKTYVTVTGIIMACAYAVISGLAGVYTEAVLKKYKQTSIHLQNTTLYIFGVIINFVGFLWQKQSFEGFFDGFSIWVWLIIISQGLNGIITSYILKHSSTISRLFCIASSTLLTPVLSFLVFGVTVDTYFVAAVFIIIYALYLYFNDSYTRII